jgi:hypothetical protein
MPHRLPVSPGGRKSSQATRTELQYAEGIAVSPSGRLLIADDAPGVVALSP